MAKVFALDFTNQGSSDERLGLGQPELVSQANPVFDVKGDGYREETLRTKFTAEQWANYKVNLEREKTALEDAMIAVAPDHTTEIAKIDSELAKG